MKLARFFAILALFLSALGSLACSGNAGKNANSQAAATANHSIDNPNSPKTNVEELGLLVNIPYTPEDIVWKEDAAHKHLTGVLRFSAEDAGKLVAEAGKIRAPQNVSVPVESWFPDELVAQADMSGDSSLKGVSYAANNFYQEPYVDGRIIRVEGGDYFILELAGK